MIPKHELRLGNWIINKEGNFCKIKTGASIDDADNFSAIELNEVILKKCGFSFHDYSKTWQKVHVLPKIGHLLQMDQNYNVKDFGQKYIGVRLTALHQLQNLLFQLKGVEIDFEVAENLNIEDISPKIVSLPFQTISKN